MTISTTTSRALYAGNGVTTIFSFPYLFLANGDLEVRLIEASGASTVLTLTTDYTVTGANNDAGGSVTMIVAPASGEQLLIRRIVDLTQETAYPSGDPFPAESHERALDKLTMMVQQHDEELARTLQVPPESDVDASTINIEAVEVVAGIAADVSAVAAIDDEVVIAADNIAAILAAPAEAAAAAASALAADASADAAAASAASIALPLAIASGGTGQTTAALAFAAIKQAASTSATGVVEIATNAEAQAGTDTTRAITAANLKAAQIQIGTAVTLTTQTSVDFTGIPSFAKRVDMMFAAVSTNGTSPPFVQLGDSGGIDTAGYLGSVSSTSAGAAAAANFTSGVGLLNTNSASVVFHGAISLQNISGNTWVITGTIGRSDAAAGYAIGFRKTLTDTLTQLRLTTAGGTDQFDAGIVNISYE